MTVTIHQATFPLSEAEIAPWRSIPVAVAADLCPDALIDPNIRPLLPAGQQPRLCGPAVTCRPSPPDYGAVPHSLDEVPKGGVLVIATNGVTSHAMIGGILAGYLRTRGVAGLVCDGAIRDVAEIAEWDDLSVFCRAVTPLGPEGKDQGDVHRPVTIGATPVETGHLILGDDDGLVALPPQTARDLLPAAQDRVALEDRWMADLAAGRSLQDTFGHTPPKRL